MPKTTRIDPAACSPLDENTPEPQHHTTPYTLPPDFPHIPSLTEDDILELREWWTRTITTYLDRLRDCISLGANTNPSTAALLRNSAALAHLLGLHPAAAPPLHKLAAELQTSYPRLLQTAEAQRAILSGTPASTLRRPPNPTLRQLLSAHPELDAEHRTKHGPVHTIPFRAPHLPLIDQWHTVTSLSHYPGVTATLDLTADNRNAVRITLNSHKD